VAAKLPASGSSAPAASRASLISIPPPCRVAAQATTTKNPITPVSTAPTMTSTRS
jgi:hypothetical protein